MAVKNAWTMAAEAVKALPPLLKEDDITIQRFYKAHKGELTCENEARTILEALAEDGKLVRVECRTGRGGSHVTAYRLP